MNDKSYQHEVNKMIIQQQQWHDEYTQRLKEHDLRDKHWFWQRGFWLFMAGVAVATIGFKVIT